MIILIKKFPSIVSTVVPARRMMIVFARLKETKRFSARKPNRANMGISPGYIRKEALNSPWSYRALKTTPRAVDPKQLFADAGQHIFVGE